MRDEDLEAGLLGGRRELTREQVSERSGVPLDEARDVWAAMGLPEVPAGEVAFTERDVQALQTVGRLRESGLVDLDTTLVLARVMGQGLSRLAEAQVDVFRERARGLSPDEAVATARAGAQEVLPDLERLVVHVWRRQFAAAAVRSFEAARQDGLPRLAVGFVDLEGFTRTSREWGVAELQELLERFERESSLRVTAAGGRVIKTLGDEVLFVAEQITAAAEIALGTVAAHAEQGLPEVRGGLALGPVLVRLGDVFGQPVNLASRLTSEARPGTVLVDLEAASALEQDPAYELVKLRQRAVRGYRALRPHVLRRSSGPV